MHPYDIPDVAHPPVSGPEITELDVAPMAMGPEWINSEALNAAVVHAAAFMDNGALPWSTDDVIRVAKVYREFIKGEMDS